MLAVVAVSLGAIDQAAAESSAHRAGPTVAVVAPLSGELSGMGEQLVEAARLAASDTEVRIRAIDEGESTAEMVSGLRRALLEDGVEAVIGPVRRQRAKPAARLADEFEVPLIALSPVDGVERHSRWVFRARPSPEERARHLATYLVRDREHERIGIVGPRSRYGDALISAVVEAVIERGGTVAATGRYEEGTTDFRPALEVLVGKRARIGADRSVGRLRADRYGTVEVRREGAVDFDALLIADAHDTVARILPFLPRVGIATAANRDGEAVALVGVAEWRGDGLKRVGEHAEGAVFFDVYGGFADGGEGMRFARWFDGKTGRMPTTPEAEVYDLVRWLGSAVQQRPTGNGGGSLGDALHSQPFEDGATGRWAFDGYGAPVREAGLYQVTGDGGWTPIGGAE